MSGFETAWDQFFVSRLDMAPVSMSLRTRGRERNSGSDGRPCATGAVEPYCSSHVVRLLINVRTF